MKAEMLPRESERAAAFSLWMSSPMPMVTLVKTMDVNRLTETAKHRGMKFTMLMCWCIGKAASGIKEFFTLPEGGKLFRYDRLAVNVIVKNRRDALSSCDIPVSDNLEV
ncbi:MAG: chloramphenicol acetyltransferase, partial [Schwartzia sp.]|nr:chloramphenicol acetyltransferase [Schwartzia sp. (in: firmicutes)]